MKHQIETGFYVSIGKNEPIYIIEDDCGSYLAVINRRITLKPNGTQYYIAIDYELELNVCKKFNSNEIRMLRIYFDNVVNALTRDIQTIYTDNLEERMQLPFYTNILHLKPYDK